jgi:hypothetical protein
MPELTGGPERLSFTAGVGLVDISRRGTVSVSSCNVLEDGGVLELMVEIYSEVCRKKLENTGMDRV